MTTFKFYNIMKDEWHEFVSLGDKQRHVEFTYRDNSLLSKISDIMNHIHPFALVPFQNGVPDFSKTLEISQYPPEDIDLILMYMADFPN